MKEKHGIIHEELKNKMQYQLSNLLIIRPPPSRG